MNGSSTLPAAASAGTRDQLVERHLGLARHIARSYRHDSSIDEDLIQVAMLALVHAAERFDPSLGVQFASFAGCTINGEIKRYFRDLVWPVRIPRAAKELHLRARPAYEELQHALGRPPTRAELALRLGVPVEEATEALGLPGVAWTESLDTATIPTLDELTAERPFEQATDRLLAWQLIDELPELERRVVLLRFFDDLTQDQIARRIGVSQMQVSRLIARALARMRELGGPERAELASVA